MNKIFRHFQNRDYVSLSLVFLLLIGSSSWARSQQAADKIGFFTVVNAVDLPKNTMLLIDNRPLRKEGLRVGEMIGPLGLAEGNHTIVVSNDAAVATQISLPLNGSGSPIVVIYLVDASAGNGPPKPTLKLYARGNRPGTKHKAFSVIYAGKSAQAVSFNGTVQSMIPLREENVGGDTMKSLTISQNGKSIANILPEEAGNYLIILYDSPLHGLGYAMVQDVVHHAAR